MDLYSCPVCGGRLAWGGHACRCPEGHSFDIAAQGYVNLLLANQKSSPNPGDNAEMVAGAHRFLDSGSYAPLSDALNGTVLALCGDAPRILDAGCGEGYYAARLFEALEGAGRAPALFGVDLSKPAVRHAARRCRGGRFAVASLFALPLADGSADLVYNVFSPLCPREFSRVLAPGGHFVAAYPAARHLWGLKSVLYDAPYENADKSFELEGFHITDRRRVRYSFTLEGSALIESLFSMTPYYYKTPAEGAARLAALETLTTEADFWVVAYGKGEA